MRRGKKRGDGNGRMEQAVGAKEGKERRREEEEEEEGGLK